MDVKETSEVVDVVVALVKVGGDVAASGKPGLGAALAVLGAIQKVPAAVDGITKVPAELKDMDQNEKAVLFKRIEALDIPQDQVEVWAERILKASLVLGGLVADYVTLKTA